jgi:2-methylisocitrate lyase-like PEP mutase family enzyme
MSIPAVSHARTLRRYIADGETRLVVSGYDALTAKTAAMAGIEVLHLTGYGAAAALAGAPDIGLLSVTEMAGACARMVEAADRPLIADIDTGYGNALNVRRTIRTMETAGAAGIHLEDQVHPKRCGHMAGKRVVPVEEMVAKVKAACDARRDDDFVIIARTDANAIEGLDATLERAARYREAGADMLFVEAPTSREEIVRIAGCGLGPQLFNWAYDGLTPHVPIGWLRELGFPLVLYADVAQVVHRAFAGFVERLVAAGSLDDVRDLVTGFDAFNSFVGLEEWRELEERYGAAADPGGPGAPETEG